MSNTGIKLIDRYRGALLGLASGDAVGCTVEFLPRGRFRPLSDMVGGGKFNLNAGEWTDDTSMAICLATSLVEKMAFDPKDQMDRYLRWVETGNPGPKPHPIGIGKTILNALFNYRRTGEPYSGISHERSAGNGALMRLAPVILACYPNHKKTHEFVRLSTITTHAAEACIKASYHLAEALFVALSGANKREIQATCPDWQGLDVIPDTDIRGSGYAPESLQAAVWSFLTTETFEQAILTAANLGDDADTTAAICGQIAGAYYGCGAIPEHWMSKLYMRDVITALADALHCNAEKREMSLQPESLMRQEC